MKRFSVLLLLVLPACDKALHAGAGAAISLSVYEATGNRELSCLASAVVGVAKEAIDPIPDPFDIAATIAGGCGALTIGAQ